MNWMNQHGIHWDRLRYSSAGQNPRSLDDQLHIILEKAQKENIFIPWQYVFADASVTGTVANRFGYHMAQSVLKLTDEAEISTIYLDEVDRASRDGLQILLLGNTVKNLEKRMVGVSNNFDSSEPQSSMKLYFYAMYSYEYVSQHRAKVNRGKRGVARRGTVNGYLAFGLKPVPGFDANGRPLLGRGGTQAKVPAVDEKWSWAIDFLAELFVDRRWSTQEIAREFNRRRIGEKASWAASTITRMLRNKAYIGIFIYGVGRHVKDSVTGKVTHLKQPRSNWTVYRVRNVQLCSLKRWKQIQARMEEIQDTSPKSFKNMGKRKPASTEYPKTLFSNILHCGYCGRPLVMRRGGWKPSLFCYAGHDRRDNCKLTCSKSVSVFEPPLISHILTSILTKDRLRQLVEKTNECLEAESKKPPVETSGLHSSLKKIKNKRDRLISLVADGSSSEGLTSVRNRITTLEKEIKQISNQIQDAQHINSERLAPLCQADSQTRAGFVLRVPESWFGHAHVHVSRSADSASLGGPVPEQGTAASGHLRFA